MIIQNMMYKTRVPLISKVRQTRKSLDDSDTKRNMIVRIPLTNFEMSPIGKSQLRRADSASPSLVGSTLKKLPNRFCHNDIDVLP
jgi:hypothetical protein